MKSSKRLLALAPAFALIATGAFAATMTKSGEIKSVDAAKHELVLTSGDTFEIPNSIKTQGLTPGSKVTVSYDSKDGKMVASKITHDKAVK